MWALALAAVVLTSCVVLLRRSKTKAARRPSDTLKETVETLAEEIEKPQLKCAMCGMDDGHVYGGLRRCGRCKTTWYCTAECQRAHWPAHRCNCEAIAARGGLKLLTASGKAAQVAVDAAKAYLALPPSLRAWSLRPEAAAMREDSRFVRTRAAKESDIPNFKGSYFGRFPLVLADFWTSDHLSERSRSINAFSGTRARGTLTLKRR